MLYLPKKTHQLKVMCHITSTYKPINSKSEKSTAILIISMCYITYIYPSTHQLYGPPFSSTTATAISQLNGRDHGRDRHGPPRYLRDIGVGPRHRGTAELFGQEPRDARPSATDRIAKQSAPTNGGFSWVLMMVLMMVNSD